MIIHTVKQGESVENIAAYYHTSSTKIIEDNGLSDPDKLVVGQSIVILGTPLFALPDDIVKMPPDRENREIIVNGYSYPFTVFLDGLEEALPHLTYLSIFSYEARADGSLVPIEDKLFIEKADVFGVSPRMVVSNISEEGSFDGQLAHTILEDKSIREDLIMSILEILEKGSYSGVDMDFENLYPEDQENYNLFMTELSEILHKEGFTLSAAIEKKTNPDVRIYRAHDYKAQGVFNDLVILMTYDWGYLFGPPMAIAPANEIERVLQYAVAEMPPEKILMGIPNYAFDWSLPYKEGVAASPMSHVEAVQLAEQKHAVIEYDEEAQSPYFYYQDENKEEHVVWFEDARSVYAKLQLVKKYSLGGVSYWTVNKSWPQNWSVLSAMFETAKLIPLQ